MYGRRCISVRDSEGSRCKDEMNLIFGSILFSTNVWVGRLSAWLQAYVSTRILNNGRNIISLPMTTTQLAKFKRHKNGSQDIDLILYSLKISSLISIQTKSHLAMSLVKITATLVKLWISKPESPVQSDQITRGSQSCPQKQYLEHPLVACFLTSLSRPIRPQALS